MYKTIVLILMILSVTTFSQENRKLNPIFYNTWVESDYYEKIMNCKTPCELNSVENNIIELYFFETNNQILFASFYEGIKRNFTIENSDTIEVLDLNGNESIIYLFNDKNKTKLVLKSNKKTLYYDALDKKYYLQNGIDHLIRDMFLVGKYVVEGDSTKKVIFTSDGNVSGIGNFNKYKIPIKGIELPSKYDIVLLLEIDKKIRNTMLLHWEKSKEEIVFYNVSKSSDEVRDNGKYSESEILTKFLTLKK